ncbi:MAG: FKBP-type peptidyl-prolyl cis-trans isomerase [Phycisphaerales bacterium]|nr:FKBP-type peptidyl-prolyl cis-trans isomerase [Planctomycetota bacterium]
MRIAAFLVAAACLPALAADPKPVTATPTSKAPAPAQSGAQQAPSQAQPEADALPPPPPKIAIPDGPAVSKQELEGGLIIEDIKIGEGYEVKPGGAVVALYHGTLKESGKEFDSAFRRGEPVAFPLSGVIEGWQKGVPGMKIGGIRKLTVPAKMGYGERGAGASIPPNSDLVFIIQLEDALQVIDEKPGTGEEATNQAVAVTTYEIKDNEGKVVSKADSSNPYIWVPNELMAMTYGLEGMKVGGRRKIIVPKQMCKTNPQSQITLPADQGVTIEFDLLGVRNFGPKKGK